MPIKRHLLKLDCLFCIVLVCSEPQQVFKYLEYLKALLYHHILSIIPTRLMKLDAIAYFHCANDDVKSVKQHTRN